MAELRFDGRVAIVTGAGRGVGRCHALLLASRGARVVVADHGGAIDGTGSSPETADDVVLEIEQAGGEAVACCASVAEESSAAAIVEAAIDSFGRLDVVFNNAGIHDPGLFGELSNDQFRSMSRPLPRDALGHQSGLAPHGASGLRACCQHRLRGDARGDC